MSLIDRAGGRAATSTNRFHHSTEIEVADSSSAAALIECHPQHREIAKLLHDFLRQPTVCVNSIWENILLAEITNGRHRCVALVTFGLGGLVVRQHRWFVELAEKQIVNKAITFGCRDGGLILLVHFPSHPSQLQ